MVDRTEFSSRQIRPPEEEASKFMADLSNYIPLGCLAFEDFSSPDDGAPNIPGQWRALPQVPLFIGSDACYGSIDKLLHAGWIAVESTHSVTDPRYIIFRIHVLPGDVGHRLIDRQNSRLDMILHKLLAEIDVSPLTWNARFGPESKLQRFDLWATGDDSSLFYLFNKLPSPAPDPLRISEKYAHEALEDLLDPASILGLKTTLYPYQRRSAGLMLQRESVARLELDPRLEARVAPDGSTFYYSPRSQPVQIFRHPRYYEACRGGILAESMGLGKTVVLLALILATKNQPPKMPPDFALPTTRPAVGSLMAMAVSAVNRKSVPWKVEFDRIVYATGIDLSNCRKRLEEAPASYDIPQQPQRWNRKTVQPPPKKVLIAATTLIVVPRNLFKQWLNEIEKHVERDAINLLVMEQNSRALPPPQELCKYDVILFSRNRFDLEEKDGSDEHGRRLMATQLLCHCPYIGATRSRNCNCVRTDDLYNSPLKHVHFKRLIIDEGHFFSNKDSRAVQVANKLITVDHRWVVSGTPAKDLFGVEVDMSSSMSSSNVWHAPESNEDREAVLSQRRHFSAGEDTCGAIKSLGSLATHFLKVRPWAPLEDEKKVDWDDYIYRHEHLTKRTNTAFSICLKRTLEAMVVKTQAADVERDIELPPLRSRIVRLEPCFYDKLTANLFTLVLTANAVTSERTDADYLFHKNSAKARNQLITNLRQSAAIWTGFGESEINAVIKNSTGYLSKENTGVTPHDRDMLTDMLSFADLCLTSLGWHGLSRLHELGIFVDSWPAETAEHWSLDGCQAPLLTGISQLLDAQKHINERADLEDPAEGLAGAGISALAPVRRHTATTKSENASKSVLTKGIPISSLDGEPALKRRGSQSGKSLPTKPTRSPTATNKKHLSSHKEQNDGAPTILVAGRKRRRSQLEQANLPVDSPYRKSRVVGTTSAKISYLVSQIIKYQSTEKILVFFDKDNVAYYIAQVLELLNIRHEIYANSLSARLKSEYVVRFNEEPYTRVLLMDVKQAAYGLNMSAASRIYFVNPVCRPNVEAQAIKRAHRIGQTRTVRVETLVLSGSLEEKMLERSQRMTRSEHQDAKVLEDDGAIQEIIQSARALPIFDNEKTGYGQMARLELAQQLFSRDDWQDVLNWGPNKTSHKTASPARRQSLSDSSPAFSSSSSPSATITRRRKLTFVDITSPDFESRTAETAPREEGNSPAPSPSPSAMTSNPDSPASSFVQRKRRRKLTFVDITNPDSESRTAETAPREEAKNNEGRAEAEIDPDDDCIMAGSRQDSPLLRARGSHAQERLGQHGELRGERVTGESSSSSSSSSLTRMTLASAKMAPVVG